MSRPSAPSRAQARTEHAAVAAKLATLATTAPLDKATMAGWSKRVSQLRSEAEGYGLRAEQFEAEAERAKAERYAAEVVAWHTAEEALKAEALASEGQGQAQIVAAEAALLGAQLALETARTEAQSRAAALAEQAALLQAARFAYAPGSSRKRL